MVTALQSGEIDIAVGLTEGWVAGICKAQSAQKDPGYKIVGTYVDTPLRWAISTGIKRDDLNGVDDLKGKKVGVSRIGSGSYVMSYVLAHEKGWLDPNSTQPPFPVEVLNTFKNLRDGVNDGTADFFMWEYFTSKRYYDNGEIKHIGDQYSPWSSWMIVAANPLLYPNGRHDNQPALTKELEEVLSKINTGIQHFKENEEEAVEYISTKLDYSQEDAKAWLPTVEFAKDVRGADFESAKNTVFILQQAGVVEENLGVGQPEDLIALQRV
jgi:ABC-type nitrate/sulfonate/bicarbonate transport system substrate-binding protein